jgi:hypothetical protein
MPERAMMRTKVDVRVMVRSLLVIILISVVVTACGSRKEIKIEKDVRKKEMPLWQVLTHRRSPVSFYSILVDKDKMVAADKFVYEDRWYRYIVEFERLKSGQVNRIFTSCPISQAQYMVIDKKSDEVVRNETILQASCRSCHLR